MTTSSGIDAPSPPGRRMRARGRWERLRIEVLRRRLRAAEKRLLDGEMRVEQLKERLKGPGRDRLPKTELKKDQRARARTHGSYATWEDLIMSFGSREGLRWLMNAGLIGRSLPQLASAPMGQRILVLVPHQDDEGIAAAGTLLLAHRRGSQLRIVYYTDGATTLGAMEPGEVAQLRAHEARRAWSRRTGAQLDFVGVPTGATDVPDAAADRLTEILDEFDPTVVFLPTFLEEPYEHRLLTRWLLRAAEGDRLRPGAEIWGYQVTTRLSGNAVVDISDVAREKRRLNRAWSSQNALLDYAALAAGQDMANALYLSKAGATLRKGAGHGEVFIRFEAPRYFTLARSFLDLEEHVEASLGEEAPTRTRPASRSVGGGEVRPPDFFVVGLQKCGTYWVTALLNAHPKIRCFPSLPAARDGAGEAHLFDVLARMESDYERFHRSMSTKLGGALREALPEEPPADAFARGQLAQRLTDEFARFCDRERRRHGKPLVGEKTTETVHHLDLLERLFPGVRKVAVLRDPRDRVVSFHFHQQRKRRTAPGPIGPEDVDSYIKRVRRDYTGLLDMVQPSHVFTYEDLSRAPHAILPPLLEFLGVGSSAQVVRALVEQASFSAVSGRSSGEEDRASHFRKGVVGDWRSHLTSDDAERMVAKLDPLTRRVEERFGLDLSAYRAPTRGCPAPASRRR